MLSLYFSNIDGCDGSRKQSTLVLIETKNFQGSNLGQITFLLKYYYHVVRSHVYIENVNSVLLLSYINIFTSP